VSIACETSATLARVTESLDNADAILRATLATMLIRLSPLTGANQMKLRLSQFGSKIADVTSERAARKLAKELLGTSRLVETPTASGWQYWRPSDAEDSEDVVTIKVL
jgi:hypothetical protein